LEQKWRYSVQSFEIISGDIGSKKEDVMTLNLGYFYENGMKIVMTVGNKSLPVGAE
jgi:hypothetical protein